VSSRPLPHRDASPSLDARLDDLLARMSLEEKLAQLGGVWSTQLAEAGGFSERRARALLAHGIGCVTRIGAATGLRPRERAAFANRIQRFLREETRLGIPALVHEEGLAGLCARDADQFPQAIGLAATFEPELVEGMARVIRAQMRATGARHVLAPVLDVARDPRWGRAEETYGECPYLASRMGVAYVRGIQGEGLAGGVAATGKHFLAYGLSEGGLNHAPVQIGPRELRDVFAAPFAAAIAEAELAAVMNSYAAVDGLPCGGAREILDGLLRGELGFEGPVVADYFTTRLLVTHHRVASDLGDAAQLALEAGLDVELPQLEAYGAPLRERLEKGLVPEALVDRSVRRVLRLKLALGLFDAPLVDEAAAEVPYGTRAARRLARRLAAKSFVLLKNEGGLLPLRPALRRLAVIGPAADDPRLFQGDYAYPAHAEILYAARAEEPARAAAGGAGVAPRPEASAFPPGPYFPPTATLLAGLRDAAAGEAEIRHARGCDVAGGDRSGFAAALDAARWAEVAIVAVGGRSGLVPECTSGEFRDAAELGLPGVQQALVEAVVATGTPTAVVLVSGRPLAIPWIAAHVPAVVAAWVPGEEGGSALADVLLGRTSPAGRLPVTLPRAAGQVPSYYDHRAGGGRSQMLGDYADLPAAPLYPFGHGLSYARFEYRALRVEPSSTGTRGRVRITLEVTNAGDVESDEVVQLYVRGPLARVTRPVKQLAGFLRLPLRPQQTRLVVFELDVSQLAFHGEDGRLAVEPGAVDVLVGASSADVRLEGRFAIEGARRPLRPAERVPTLAWAVA